MHISWRSSLMSLLSGFILFSLFTSAQAAAPSLGTWTPKNPGLSTTENYDIYGMAYGNNTFVIVGQNVSAYKAFTANSPDGNTWTVRSTGSTAKLFHSVIFSKGRFIAVCKQPDSGNARIWTSDDNGNTWRPRDSDDEGLIVAGGLHAVVSDGKGNLVAAGGAAVGGGWITRSMNNGTSWHIVRNTPTTFHNYPSSFYGVGYALGSWYAITKSSTYGSSDMDTWNDIGGPAVDDLGYKVASNETTVVIASTIGPKWTNDSGETWHSGIQAKGYEALSSLGGAISSIVYADGYFVLAARNPDYDNVAGKYYADIWISETGREWKRWKTAELKHSNAYTFSLCYAKKAFWCGGWYEKLSKSPPWFKARNGCSSDYPYTLFDAEDGPPNRIGLPQYRVNTSSLNLVLESTLFYSKGLGAPINLKLTYNSRPTANTDTTIGPFGKNWRFKYESVVGRFGEQAQLTAGGGRSYKFTTPVIAGNAVDLDTVTNDVTLLAPDGNFDTLKYIYNAGNPRFELTVKASHLTFVYGTKGTNVSVNDSLFYLSAIKDQFGNTTTLTVTPANGQISSIADQSSRTFNFTYTSGLCTKITMPDGRSVIFAYDAVSKALTSITDMMGYVGTYAYDANGFITSMSTAGKTTTFTYENRPGYNDADTVDNKGDKYLSSLTRPIVGTTKYELLDDGDTVKRTAPSGEVTLISNKDGQTTSVKDPLGNVRNIAFNDAKLPETVTDEKGGVYSYEYDDFGNMTKQTDAMGTSTTYVYDDSNHSDLLTATNALGKIWTYTYNAKYQPLTITTPLGSQLSYKTEYTYFGNGRVNTIIDANGKTTTFTYDGNGNVLTATSPVGGVTTLTYYPQGFQCKTMTDPNLNVKTIEWDNNDRLTKIIYTSVSGTPSYTNSYNAFGQNGFLDELGNPSTVVRDDLGFVTSFTNPLGFLTQKEYDIDSRPTKTIDPLGRSTSTSYDSAGRPILFTDARGFKIVQEYDGTGNLVSFKDKNGAETIYTYDANGRLISTTDPLKKVSTVTRDAIGRTSSIKNARLQIIGYEYDDDGHLKKKTFKPTDTSASTTLVDNTVIDKNGNITKQIDTWGTTLATATQYVYDNNNRITKITYPDSTYVDLAWYPGGQLKTVTFPDGLIYTYTYDLFNRQQIPSVLKNNPGTELMGESRSTNAVTQVKLSGPIAATFDLTYDDRGQIATITRPNGTLTTYSLDNGGRVINIAHSGTATVDLSANCTPDEVGNITSQFFDGTSYYQSSLYLANSTILAYNAAGQLTKKGVQACVNDADGNLTDLGAGTVKCTYDAENRLTKMVRKNSDKTITTTNNTYNAGGLRVKRETVDGSTVVYHYLTSGTLLYTTDAGGTIIDRHIFAGSTLLATYKATGGLIHYYGDMQGNVRLIANNAGAALVQYDYLPYGQVGVNLLNVNDAIVSGNTFTFAGILGVQDEGNGIFCMGKRFYEAASARFLSRDPLGFAAGSNLYAYGRNNPIIYADPTGSIPLAIPLIMAGVGFIYWCMDSAESHENANAKSAEINAKYRAEELQKRKEFEDRYKGFTESDKKKFAEAEGLGNYYEKGVKGLAEGTEQGMNRLGEAGEIGANTLENAVVGKGGETAGAVWDATKAVYKDVNKSQQTEGGE